MSKRVLICLSSWILMKKNSYNCYLCYLRTLQSYFKLHAKTKSQFEPNLKNSCSKDEQIKTLSHDVRNLSLYKTKHFIFAILTIPVNTTINIYMLKIFLVTSEYVTSKNSSSFRIHIYIVKIILMASDFLSSENSHFMIIRICTF